VEGPWPQAVVPPPVNSCGRSKLGWKRPLRRLKSRRPAGLAGHRAPWLVGFGQRVVRKRRHEQIADDRSHGLPVIRISARPQIGFVLDRSRLPLCKSLTTMSLFGCLRLRCSAASMANSLRSRYVRGVLSIEISNCATGTFASGRNFVGVFTATSFPNLPRPRASLPDAVGSYSWPSAASGRSVGRALGADHTAAGCAGRLRERQWYSGTKLDWLSRDMTFVKGIGQNRREGVPPFLIFQIHD